MSWISQSSKGVILAIHATPRASASRIEGLHGDSVKIRLQAPPVDGKANEALIHCLSEKLGIAARDIVLLSGETGRRKRILIHDLSASVTAERLGLPLPPSF
jgi:uncharacterized protein (TIGR00251 family)